MNIKITKGFFKRAGWMFLVILFVVTGLGVGVVSFLQNIHQNKNDSSQVQQTTNLKGTTMQNFTPISAVDSLQIIDNKVGEGGEVKAGSTVSVIYTGAVAATGAVFDSNADTGKPVTFGLDQVIKGWSDGLVGMKVGGERRLLIPSALAYGPTPPYGSGIPANADLVFDVTLLDTK